MSRAGSEGHHHLWLMDKGRETCRRSAKDIGDDPGKSGSFSEYLLSICNEQAFCQAL